ncbi:hypothetical protein MMC07_000768 [Pseudocyphellaria aurata]|nr:hypothetical protein [Pseudocyphellaria aurata]
MSTTEEIFASYPAFGDGEFASPAEPLSRISISSPFPETSVASSPFSNEEWEEWMKWDGAAEALAPPHQLHSSDTSKEPARSPRSSSEGNVVATRSSPETAEHAHVQPISKKRKSTECTDTSRSGQASELTVPQTSKRSHTVIEKRYRTNLNHKIAALRESVPSLRNDSQDPADLGGLSPASKLNKATVLSKAMEYIQHLERRNGSLEKENAKLRSLPRPWEQPAAINERMLQDTSEEPIEESRSLHSQSPPPTACDRPSPATSPKGMIRVPDSIRNLRSSASQAHYAVCSCNDDELPHDASPKSASTRQQRDRGRIFGNLMVGSLAGLLIMDGFSDRESDGNQPGGRGLLALPRMPFSYVARMFWTLKGELAVSAPVLLTPPMTSLLKLFLVLATVAFGLFLYLFSSKPKSSANGKATVLVAAPSLASPIEVRQKAWLTAIQTVGVPRHRMLPELIALHLGALKYVTRQLIGWPGYAWLTGRTEEDEIARVRAWDIAIDAQLTGGDSEVSKSRLVLTIFASGTLPSTPARLMLKALHIRILLWEATKSGWSIWSVLHKAAAQLARHQWLLAQEIQKSKSTSSNLPDVRETLPEHLSALLQLSSDELFTDIIVQRAYNLAWNRPTGEDTMGEDIGIDTVVEDYAIRSPLDALSAWASSVALQRALVGWYEEGGILSSSHQKDLELALHIAPPASGAYARALAARAVFLETDRDSHVTELLQDLLPNKMSTGRNVASSASESVFFDSSIPERVRNDIEAAVQCACILGYLKQPVRQSDAIDAAVDFLESVYLNASDKTLLGFAVAHKLLLVLVEEQKSAETESRLHRITLRLSSWVDGLPSNESKLDGRGQLTMGEAIDQLVPMSSAKRRVFDGSSDTEYGSMHEGEKL